MGRTRPAAWVDNFSGKPPLWMRCAAAIFDRPLVAFRFVSIMGVTIDYYDIPIESPFGWLVSCSEEDGGTYTLPNPQQGGTGILWAPWNARAEELYGELSVNVAEE